MMAQCCACTKCHWIVPFQMNNFIFYEHFILYEFYLILKRLLWRLGKKYLEEELPLGELQTPSFPHPSTSPSASALPSFLPPLIHSPSSPIFLSPTSETNPAKAQHSMLRSTAVSFISHSAISSSFLHAYITSFLNCKISSWIVVI